MIDVSIKVDAQTALNVLNAVEPRALTPKIANAIADEDVLPALHKYPQQSRKPMKWASDKQRRFVMAAIRSGDIQVPYRRTGDYGRSFDKQPTQDGLNLVSELAYAPYVRGPGQAAYHKGNWTTLDELAEELEADAALTATGVIVDEIAKAGP